MKRTCVSLALLVQMTASAETNSEPIYRGPPIAPSFDSNIMVWEAVAQSQLHGRHVTLTEAEYSDPYSSAENVKDYFAVYVPGLSGGGTILELNPMPTSPIGIIMSTVTLRDVINNINYPVFLTRTSTGDFTTDENGHIVGLYHMGSFGIGGQAFFIRVNYYLTPRYPTVALTWGEGSAPAKVGRIQDDLSSASVETNPPPTNMVLDISYTSGDGDIPAAVYVGVLAPDENYTLESVTNLGTGIWVELPPPFFIYGYTGLHFFELTNGAPAHPVYRSKR